MKLTPITSAQEIRDDTYKSDTVSLVEYGLRDGGILSEYDLATRLEELRGVALDLANDLRENGMHVSSKQMQLIDVLAEKTVEERISVE